MNITLLDWTKTFTQRLALHAEETGQVLFDGHWQSVQEVEQRYRRLKRASVLKVVEMLVVLLLMLSASVIPIIVLGLVGGIVR